MEKFSVKKPYTILVMVMVIIILGIVSVSSMTTDLLPNINLPYMIVVTSYPGASPEKVESEICEPMERALGSVTGVVNVTSSANENYGIVQLEFEDGTDMDASMVKVSSALDPVKDILPEECGTPSLMEIGTDMMASKYLSVKYEGKDIQELTKFVDETVISRFERQKGVTSVSAIGMVENTIQVELNQKKIDKINNKILAKADEKFAEALQQLEDAEQKLLDGQSDVDENRQKLKDSEKELADGRQELIDGEKDLAKSKQELYSKQKDLNEAKDQLENGKKELDQKKGETYDQLAAASQAADQLSAYQAYLVQLQATKQATEAAIKAIDERKLSEMKAQIAQMLEMIEVLQSLPQMSPLGESAQAVNAMGMALAQMNLGDKMQPVIMALTNATAETTIAEIAPALVTAKTVFEKQEAEIDQALVKKENYQASLDSLNVEIQVTMNIIAKYEEQLAASGMSYEEIEKLKMQAASGFGSAEAELKAGETTLENAQTQLDNGKKSLEDAESQLKDGWDSLDDAQKQLEEGQKQIEDAQKQIDDGWKDYEDAVKQFEKQKAETLRTANIDSLVDVNTLSQLIYAQNFSMPAGYIDDQEDHSWLVKIGEHFKSLEELEQVLLTKIDDVGDIRLCDVADLYIFDNSDESYARMNGSYAVILSIFKSSTVGTNDVSRATEEIIKELEKEFDGLKIYTLMDQGVYISMIIRSVLENMIVGAVLAIVVLALFLKDVKPTIVVALSIPLSVLAALILMYFCGISLNMMSLSGLALGIGMLVDNSIVVIENIYRLRTRGIQAARAAVQGTKQVLGAIIASTVTSVCVFFPMVFTTGTVSDLMMPICLTIIFTLGASLFIAMTLVPAAGATLLKESVPKEHKLFERVQEIYGKALEFCLKVKVVPLSIAIGLLAFSIVLVAKMGIVMIPEMTSTQIEGTISMSEDKTKEECYQMADEITAKILSLDAVDYVGVMSGGEATLFSASAAQSSDQYFTYSFMVNMKDENAGHKAVKKLVKEMEEICKDFDCEASFSTGMGDMAMLFGNGFSVKVYGDDLDQLIKIGSELKDVMAKVDGFDTITDEQEDAPQVLHLFINRDEAMRLGLSVAQIYQELSGQISNEKDAVKITMDGVDMNIHVTDRRTPVSYENLLDYTFQTKTTDDDGDQVTTDHKLSEIAELRIEEGASTIRRENQARCITVTATAKEGENLTLLARHAEPLVREYELPDGYTMDIAGEYDTILVMLTQMLKVLALGLVLIYLVMVAQFQNLLSPFIVLFTIPLAFTGGLLGLWFVQEPISVMGMMGFVILMGTVVNNGIVFVDYVNQLRKGGLARRDALIVTGKTRMRPIMMTALTTILAMSMMIVGDGMSAQMGRGMAIVIVGGLIYATLMTLFIIPVMYDILFKKQPLDIDIGTEDLDDIPDDAKEYLESCK